MKAIKALLDHPMLVAVVRGLAGYGWTLMPAAILLGISPAQVLAAILFVAFLMLHRGRRLPLLPAGLGWPLAVFFGWILVAAIVARPEPKYVVDAFGKWVYILLLIPAFAWSLEDPEAGKRIRKGMNVALGLTVLMLPYMIWEVLSMKGGRAGDLSGGSPNLGTTAMMLAILFSVQALRSDARRSRLLMPAGAIVMLMAMGLTMNRGAMLGLAAGLGLIAVRRSPVIIAVILAGLIGFSTLKPDSFLVARMRCALVPSDPASRSALERIYLWGSGFRMIRDRPLAGFGGRRNFRERYEESYRNPESTIVKTPGHVHNTVLQAAILHGVPGLGLLLWWITALFRKAWRLWRIADRVRDPALAPLALAFLPLLTAVCVNALFDFVIAESQRAMMFYTLTGLILGATSAIGSRKRR